MPRFLARWLCQHREVDYVYLAPYPLGAWSMTVSFNRCRTCGKEGL